MHGSAVATSISIPRSAAAAEGRDPRSTAAEASDRSKAATRSTPEASSPAQPPFGHAGEVHSTLELELRTSNELEVRPEPVESVRGWCPRGGSIPPSDLRHHDSTSRPAPLPLLSSRFVSLVFSSRPLCRGFSATHTHHHDPLSSIEQTHSRHSNMKPRHDDRPAVIGRQQRRWLLCHDSTPVAAGPPPPPRRRGDRAGVISVCLLGLLITKAVFF